MTDFSLPLVRVRRMDAFHVDLVAKLMLNSSNYCYVDVIHRICCKLVLKNNSVKMR